MNNRTYLKIFFDHQQICSIRLKYPVVQNTALLFKIKIYFYEVVPGGLMDLVIQTIFFLELNMKFPELEIFCSTI